MRFARLGRFCARSATFTHQCHKFVKYHRHLERGEIEGEQREREIEGDVEAEGEQRNRAASLCHTNIQ